MKNKMEGGNALRLTRSAGRPLIAAALLAGCVSASPCAAAGWEEVWEAFIASPQANAISFLKLRTALSHCQHGRACPDSLEPESDQLGELMPLVEQGNAPATELTLLSLRVLEDDERDDAEELLGQALEQRPDQILSLLKQYAVPSARRKDILCNTGAEAVDDTSKQAAVLEQRRAVLARVSNPNLDGVARHARAMVESCLRHLKLPPDR